MKLVSINEKLFIKYQADKEVLEKPNRPYVLIVSLKYKGKSQFFAVPIRSNIPATAPRTQYFALPPRATTKPRNRHGIHYIKMFPVTKQYLVKYNIQGNVFATLIDGIIRKNSRQIISECQKYLDAYANGIHPKFSTNIDYLLTKLLKD